MGMVSCQRAEARFFRTCNDCGEHYCEDHPEVGGSIQHTGEESFTTLLTTIMECTERGNDAVCSTGQSQG